MQPDFLNMILNAQEMGYFSQSEVCACQAGSPAEPLCQCVTSRNILAGGGLAHLAHCQIRMHPSPETIQRLSYSATSSCGSAFCFLCSAPKLFPSRILHRPPSLLWLLSFTQRSTNTIHPAPSSAKKPLSTLRTTKMSLTPLEKALHLPTASR